MAAQSLQHTGDLAVAGLPLIRVDRLDIVEIGGVAAPQLAFLRRTQRHGNIATEFRVRAQLAPSPSASNAHTDLDARRNWSARPPYCSIFGNNKLAR